MLNDDGFLSPEIQAVENNFEKEFAFIFGRVTQYNKFFQKTSFLFKIQKNFLHHWCLAALYIRSLSTFQSIVILLKKGITREANVLLRSLYELKYIISAISKFPDLVNDYLGQEVVEMKRILKNSRKWESNFVQGITIEEVDLKLKEVGELIQSKKVRKFTIRNFAERAGMLQDYEMYYSILCLTAHSNMFDIKKHFVLDKNGIITSFNWGPNKSEISNTIGIGIETMFTILDPLRDIFSLKIEKEYSEQFNDYNEYKTEFKKNI